MDHLLLYRFRFVLRENGIVLFNLQPFSLDK